MNDHPIAQQRRAAGLSQRALGVAVAARTGLSPRACETAIARWEAYGVTPGNRVRGAALDVLGAYAAPAARARTVALELASTYGRDAAIAALRAAADML